MYMCPAVPFGVHLFGLEVFSRVLGGSYGVSKEVVEEAVEKDV